MYVAGQMAKQSSPVPRAVQFVTVVLRMPTQTLMPSAMVLRNRQLSTTNPCELTIQAPALVCSTQTREMVDPVPYLPPRPSFGSLSFR